MIGHCSRAATRWLIAGLGLALVLRVIYPNAQIVGFDTAGHVMASMRLHQTTLIAPDPPSSGLLSQVLLFESGYTTILLPWLGYELVFGLFGFTVTESALLFIQVAIGLMSLLCFYYFGRVSMGTGPALLLVWLVAATPMHFGLSRAFQGNDLFFSVFLFLSLALLHDSVLTGVRWKKAAYFIATFLFIGSFNAYMIGVGLQVLYFFMVLEKGSWRSRIVGIVRYYSNGWALVCIALPCAITFASALYALGNGLDGGYLLRLVHKGSVGLVFSPLKVPLGMLALFGPLAVAFFALVLLTCGRVVLGRRRVVVPPPVVVWLGVMFVSFFILLNTSRELERGHLYTILVPTCALVAWGFRRSAAVAAATIVLGTIYSLSVMYRVDLGFSAPTYYGATHREARNNDIGLKALGYLVRSAVLPVSREQMQGAETLGLFLDSQEGFYYMGARFQENVRLDSGIDLAKRYDDILVAVVVGRASASNLAARRLAKELRLNLAARITGEEGDLLHVFSNGNGAIPVEYRAEDLNKRFDSEYGTLDKLGRPWLGHFGYRFWLLDEAVVPAKG